MSSGAAEPCVTVKFVSDAPDLILRLGERATAAALIEEVRRQRHVADEQRVRLIHGGTELTGDQPLPPQPCVVHCTLTSAPRPERAPPPPDWLDAIGPRRLLQWSIGGFLAYANYSCFSGRAGIMAGLLVCVIDAAYVLTCFPQLLVLMR